MLVENWEFSGDVDLDAVFEWAAQKASVSHMLLVCRNLKDTDRDKGGDSIHQLTRDLLRDHLITTIKAGAWPGTELFGHQAVVFVARFDEQCAARMVATERQLFGWRHAHTPALPEDICLFRWGDQLPHFFSVTHENRAWCVGSAKPPFAPQAAYSKCERNELLIPEAEHFCDPRTRRL